MSVVDPCVQKFFSIRTGPISTSVEWMLGCNLTLNSGTSDTYYVSRSYSNNEVFVYINEMDGDFSLDDYKSKISVVKEILVRFNFDDVED